MRESTLGTPGSTCPPTIFLTLDRPISELSIKTIYPFSLSLSLSLSLSSNRIDYPLQMFFEYLFYSLRLHPSIFLFYRSESTTQSTLHTRRSIREQNTLLNSLRWIIRGKHNRRRTRIRRSIGEPSDDLVVRFNFVKIASERTKLRHDRSRRSSESVINRREKFSSWIYHA